MDPLVVHHLSHDAGVSLELPAAFAQDYGATPEGTVRFREAGAPDGDSGGPHAVYEIRLVGRLEREPGTDERAAVVAELTDGFVRTATEVLGRRTSVVDEQPVETVVLRGADEIVRHHSVAVNGSRVVVLSGTVTRPDLRAAYDAALDSTRFIDL